MIVWCCLAIILLIVGINDFLCFRIENEYVVSLLALYIVSCLFGFSGGNFIFAAEVALSVFIITFILNQFDLIGGGDVKLLVPLILFAENYMLDFIWATSIAGALLAVMYISFSKQVLQARRKIFVAIRNLKKKKMPLLNLALLSSCRVSLKSEAFRKNNAGVLRQEIPYGVALACGGLFVVWNVVLC